MVKLIGPLHSQRASGGLGRAIQFSSWKDRQFAGKKRNPSQPRTRPQLAARIFMSGMAKLWNGLSQVQKASWIDHPAAATTSAYHAYLKENSNRYQKLPNLINQIDQRNAAPTATWPATQDTDNAYLASTTLTGLSKSILLQFPIANARDNWIVIVHYAADAGDYMRYDNISAIILAETVDNYEVLIENIPPGLQGLNLLMISHTGHCRYRGYYDQTTVLP